MKTETAALLAGEAAGAAVSTKCTTHVRTQQPALPRNLNSGP